VDSGIGLSPSPPRPPLDASQPARSASHHYQAQSSDGSLRRIPPGFGAPTPLQVENKYKSSPQNGVRFANQGTLPCSRPANTSSLNPNGLSANTRDSPVLWRPQTPYPRQRKADVDEAFGTENAEKVLGPLNGRKTPTLINAPKLQWDLTKPLFTMQSRSTLDGGEEVDDKEETETEQHSPRKVERASTPIPMTTRAIDHEQHRKGNCKFLYLHSPKKRKSSQTLY
jgi:hypothetical protein